MDNNIKLSEIFWSITDAGKVRSKLAARLARIELHSARVLCQIDGEIRAFGEANQIYLHNNNCKAAYGQLDFDNKCVAIAPRIPEGLYAFLGLRQRSV
jgi:hypothetical protein